MPSLQVLMAFFGLCVVLALSPGPDNLFVLVQSAQRGWRVGLAVVVGLCIGILGHTIAVALGLAALVAASPAAFTALKLLGRPTCSTWPGGRCGPRCRLATRRRQGGIHRWPGTKRSKWLGVVSS